MQHTKTYTKTLASRKTFKPFKHHSNRKKYSTTKLVSMKTFWSPLNPELQNFIFDNPGLWIEGPAVMREKLKGRSWRGKPVRCEVSVWLDSCIKVKLCLCILEICTGDMLHSHCGGRACLCTSFVFTPWINAFLFSTAWLQSYYWEHLLPGVKRSKRHICEQVNSHKHK